MSSLPNYFISSLAETLTVGGNNATIKLSTIYTQDGQVVTTADFADFSRGIITVNPTSLSSVEFISFAAITPTTAPTGTLIGCLRGLSFKGNNQIAANQKFNVVGTPVIISFGTHNISDIMDTISNNYTTLYGLIESAVISGAAPASTTDMGVSRLTVSPNVTLGNPTISIATPAVITLNTHGLTANDIIQFTTTGALPTGLVVSTNYYVLSTGLGANVFEIALTPGGTAINTSGSQSGTHTLIKTTPVAVGTLDTRVPTQGENDALVGQSGTAVGTSNKFEDNADTSATSSAGKLVRANGSGKIDGGFASNGASGLVSLDGSSKLPAVDGSNLTNIALIPTIGATTATALDSSNPSTTTITHSLGVIPRFVRITAIRVAPGGNNAATISTGIATINNSTGAIVSSYSSVNAGAASYYVNYDGNSIAQIAGTTPNYQTAPLSGVTATQMTITFGATGFGTITSGGTMTYLWEVYK